MSDNVIARVISYIASLFGGGSSVDISGGNAPVTSVDYGNALQPGPLTSDAAVNFPASLTYWTWNLYGSDVSGTPNYPASVNATPSQGGNWRDRVQAFLDSLGAVPQVNPASGTVNPKTVVPTPEDWGTYGRPGYGDVPWSNDERGGDVKPLSTGMDDYLQTQDTTSWVYTAEGERVDYLDAEQRRRIVANNQSTIAGYGTPYNPKTNPKPEDLGGFKPPPPTP